MKRYNPIIKISRKLKKTTKKIIESSYTLDDIIVKRIKEGLNFGYEIKYYIYSNTYCPSIESEYIAYHNESTNDKVYEQIFEKITSEILPSRLSKCKIEIQNDENGKYFEVKLI